MSSSKAYWKRWESDIMEEIVKRITVELLKDGIDVYPPASHKGECKSPYCVVKDEGAAKFRTFSTQQRMYSIYCHVPVEMYLELDDFAKKCKTAVERLAPMVMPTGLETPSFLDTVNNDYSKSVEYRCYARNKLL